MLTATGLLRVPEEAPLVMLVKTLAKQMDVDASSTRTQQAYLSALKDVRRVMAAAPGSAVASVVDQAEKDAASAGVPEAPVGSEVSDFESFRRAKGGAAAG